jgi:imidazoleglycerol-phosphate dehydratase
MRTGEYSRETRETQVSVKLDLDGTGTASINTGIKYFDHLVKTLGTHSLIDIEVEAKGDMKHHVMEDVSICLGKALREAIGDGTGITRFGHAMVPMDCSLAFAAIDLVKRPYCKIDLEIAGDSIEDTMKEDIVHFLETLASSLRANIHVWVQYGTNDHHRVEAAFKALALSLKTAVEVDPRRPGIPSAKGAM